MRGALALFVVRRILHAAALVFLATSAALVLVHLAGSGAFEWGAPPEWVKQERARHGFDRPFHEQYIRWFGRAVTLDFGESTVFGRPVATLLSERVGNTMLLGLTAFALALGLGLPAGVCSAAAPRTAASRAIRAASLLLVSTPPLVTSLVLLVVAARTGLLSSASFELTSSAGWPAWTWSAIRAVPLPAVALALPTAAALERVQSRALESALREPSIAAARARGVSPARAVWVHAWRLSLPPVLGILGIVLGTVLSGSLIVEIVMTWPGLGDLMHQALLGRDLHLAAGCAASAALFLGIGVAASDVAAWVADPRLQEPA